MSLFKKKRFKKRRKIEKEPYLDSWDGSVDNEEKILEDHVSKYGWEF